MFNVTQRPFGQSPDGSEISQYEVGNGTTTVTLMDFGATLMSVRTPDQHGNVDNIVLSHSSPEAWFQNVPCFGGTCGRFANRIANAKFAIDGTEFLLSKNHGDHQLHGGVRGFHKRVWRGTPLQDDTAAGVRFQYVSADGEEGYPGELTVQVEFRLSDNNELTLEYSAATTAPTAINLTNHAYWNLRGTDSGGSSVEDTELQLFCDHYLPVDDSVIPTGQLAPVADTVMDFRDAHPIGQHLHDVPGGGYDHCYVIRGTRGTLRRAAVASDPVSGRVLEVETTETGVQLYTGNFLSGDDSTGGFSRHQAFCLETQTFPDAPNQPAFAPLGILRPGETYRQTTVHRFRTGDLS